jgi:hypothetical protein
MQERQNTAFIRGALRLVYRNDLKEMPSHHRLLAIVILTTCGIAVLSWPLVESQADQIEHWIEQNRFLIASAYLSAIAIIAMAVKKIAEPAERVLEPQRAMLPEWRHSTIGRRSGEPPPAA